MKSEGDELARGSLLTLLQSADRNSGATRVPSVKVEAPSNPAPACHTAWRERLENAERNGAIELVRGKGNRRGVIERARLRDADKLALDLGITRAPERMAAAVIAAKEGAAGRDGLNDAIEEAASKWKKGENWHRLPPDPEIVRTAFSAAAGLLDVAFGTHFRVASAQISRDSKFLEQRGAVVCAILRQALALPEDTRSDEIWEILGLVKFRHPVCLRAPVSFRDVEGTSITGRAMPWSAVCPDVIPTCAQEGDEPDFIMTVENWTSFNGQCREIDRGAIIYTHGFPAPPVRALVGQIARLWPDVPFFHWGDVDAGGLLIADSIREAAGRPIRLHQMTPALAAVHGRPRRPLTRVAAISHREDDFGELARYLCSEDCKTFEQELLPPTNPLETTT